MSAGSSGAVFLSYASQDAAAARSICHALRAAGIEVWFDQSELRGGDAWDAKIRKQIRECALFVPVISAATNARAEGYFRLEWRLAVDRSLLMADDAPFIFPIALDDVSDAASRVPDKFREVQWTRLRFDETPVELAQRIAMLLRPESPARSAPVEPRVVPARLGRRGRATWPFVATVLAVALALALWQKVRTPEIASAPNQSEPAAVTKRPPGTIPDATERRTPDGSPAHPKVGQPPLTPARESMGKARELLARLNATREDHALAEEYCQRALKLDETDADIWATLAMVNSAFFYRGFDRSPERLEKMRTSAARAIRLAPRGFLPRLAQAGAWANFDVNQEGVLQTLRELLDEQPNNQEVLRFLAGVLLNRGEFDAALATNARSAALPGGDPLALYNNARALWTRQRFAEGYAAMQEAVGERPFLSGLHYLLLMETFWLGDLERAAATLKKIPESALLEDRGNYTAGVLHYYRGQPNEALRIWRLFPRDYYEDLQFRGPKGSLLALAHEAAGRHDAARLEWRAALQVVERRLATKTTDSQLHFDKASLLACLGENAAAEAARRSGLQLTGQIESPDSPINLSAAAMLVRLGRIDELLPRLEASLSAPGNARVFPAQLRFDPRFEPVRRDSRGQELLSRYPLPAVAKK